MGEKKPQYRASLNSKYKMDTWKVIAREYGGV